MNARAKEVIGEIKGDERLAYFLEQCESPLMVSSMVHNLMGKNPEDYNRTDKFYYKKLAAYGEPDAELLKRISGFEKVQARFQEIIPEKDSILLEKVKAFLPDAYANWENAVEALIDEAKRRKATLETEDCEQLAKKKKMMESQINEISYSLEVVLGDLLVALEQAKLNSMQRIREEY